MLPTTKPLTPTQAREQRLLEAALALETESERRAFLASVGDADLRQRLEGLIAVSAEAEAFFCASPHRPAGVDLKQVALAVEPEPSPSEAVPSEVVGRYKLLEKIGEGGFGEVWMAEQREPVKRLVALKIIKPGMDSRQIVARFEAERQALAMMDHPNIAKILDAGTTDPHPQPLSLHPIKGEGGSQLSALNAQLPQGRPYFVMELVRGIKITNYCDENHLPTRERLNLFIQVCQAIQHAHQKGVIHRDIKPSNILVTLRDGVPVPKVIDFGIAKAIEGRLTDKTVFTHFQQFIGTPAYISPEQAEMSGLDIDTRADIYSLGVLLYELLVGQTPFDAREMMQAGLDALRKIIREKQPLRPSTRLTQALAAAGAAGRATPRALSSAQVGRVTARLSSPKSPCAPLPALSEHGAHGVTRPTSESEEEDQASSLRHRLKEQIAVVRGDLDCIVMKCLEKDRRRRYETANGLAADLQRHLDNEPVLARPPSAAYRFGRLVRRHQLVCGAVGVVALALIAGTGFSTWSFLNERRAHAAEVSARQTAQAAQKEANAEKTEAEHLLYVANLNLMQKAWDDNNIGRLRQLLEETATYTEHGFEWYYWQRQAHQEIKTLRGHSGGVLAVAFAPDGRRIVTGSYDHTAKVWDAASGKELLTFKGHGERIASAAFFPDGRRIITGSYDHTAKIWDATDGRVLLTLKGHSAAIDSVAVSPDGQRIVTGSVDKTAKVWDAANGTALLTFKGHSDEISSAAFSPDGQRIVTGCQDNTAKVWDAASGEERLTLRGRGVPIDTAAFSPDGRRIVTTSGNWVNSYDQKNFPTQVWDATTGKELFTLKGVGFVATAVFSPDGRQIVTGNVDTTARLWEAATGQELSTLRGHGAVVSAVAFSPNSQWIVTGSGVWSFAEDHTAKVWDATGGTKQITLKGHADAIRGVAFFPDGQRIVTASRDKTVKVWETVSGKELFTLAGHGSAILSVAVSPDGQRIVTGGYDGLAKVWDVADGKMRLTIAAHKNSFSVAYSKDGRRLVTGGLDGTARVWDADNGKALLTIPVGGGRVWSAAISPDGRQIIAVTDDPIVKVWDAVTGKELFQLKGHKDNVVSAAFSADGRRIVTGSSDATARVWEAATGKELLILQGHGSQVWPVAFSPNGERIVTGSPDGTAKVWDAASGRELLTLKGHVAAIGSVAFSPDGLRIVTGSWDYTAKIWEAATARQVAAWRAEELEADQQLAASERDQTTERERQALARTRDSINQWLVLAPIPLPTGQSGMEGLETEQIAGEGRLMPKAGETGPTDDGKLKWRKVDLTTGLIDFNALLGQEPTRSVAYAVCYIRSQTEQRGLQMWVGSEQESKVFLNGREVYQALTPHGTVEMEDSVPDLTLAAGLNTLVFKVVNEAGDWKGSIRFTDAQGNPVQGVKVSLDPEEKK